MQLWYIFNISYFFPLYKAIIKIARQIDELPPKDFLPGARAK
jgi:hypothetical protein